MFSAESISRPPPWTTTNDACSDSFGDRLAIVLDVLRLLEQLATQLQDQRRPAFPLPARDGSSGRLRRLHSSPVRSSSPSMTLRFCTAEPAAPLIRLSMMATSTMRLRS